MLKKPKLEPSHEIHWPTLHRALVDTDGVNSLPLLRDCRELSEFQAYWETLDYLQRVILGWSDLGAGVKWWFEQAKEFGDDPIMDIMKQRWNDEGQLAFYAAHLWRGKNAIVWDSENLSPAAFAVTAAAGDEKWWREFKRKERPWQYDPFYGGGDPLHLGSSENLFLREPGEWRGFRSSEAKNHFKALLITSDFLAWPCELVAFGRTLPESTTHSWHVDVFDRWFGWLGMFRRSRVTGRWFLGRHSVHMAGNPAAN